jgi:hypothetical protein
LDIFEIGLAFCPDWPPKIILLISVFEVAGIIGINH